LELTKELTTDKISLGFITAYEAIAKDLGPEANVCELGVAKGDSLELWKYLFPKGTIAGVDNSFSAIWPQGTIRILSNQADPNLPSVLSDYKEEWDLIVDDASHEAPFTATSLELLWPLVSPGGYYVIENIDLNPGMTNFAASLLHRIQWGGNMETVQYYLGLVVMKKREGMSPGSKMFLDMVMSNE
jgi:cephalosporin hydroxylase